MSLHTPLQRAALLTETLTVRLHEQSLTMTDLRVRAGLACLAVVLEHQNAIVVLLQRQPPIAASALALVRPVFESYIRGVWLLVCATEAEVDLFLSGAKPPDAASLVKRVEKVIATEEQQLLNTYQDHWSAMCAFTHTGDLQVQRWNTANAIEPAYEESELVIVLEFTAAIALLAATCIASYTKDPSLAKELLDFGKTHFSNAV